MNVLTFGTVVLRIVDVDNLVFERRQAAYLLSFITVSKTKHGHGFSYLTASIKYGKKGKMADTNIVQ